jgi:hypothetical protein
MLVSQSLFFARISNFDDVWEGRFPMFDPRPKELKQGQRTVSASKIQESFRDCIFVNCWYGGETESIAMWKIYAMAGQGVAIRSTLGRLRDSFSTNGLLIGLQSVQYFNPKQIDSEFDRLKSRNAFRTILMKRHHFAHEEEVRAFFMMPRGEGGPEFEEASGYPVKVDLTKVVESVILPPGAASWVFDVVKSVVDKYGLNVPVEPSILDDLPADPGYVTFGPVAPPHSAEQAL